MTSLALASTFSALSLLLPAAEPVKTAPVKIPQPAAGVVKVTMTTSVGVVEMELDRAKAPLSVDNFVRYAQKGHYDRTIFHRVIPGFMVQGGGFDDKMNQKAVDPPVRNEASNGLRNLRGTLAMARTNDPHSATSQFFVNVVDNDFLDPNPKSAGYAVFGRVVKGMEVMDKIVATPTGRVSGFDDVPLKPVYIESMKVR
jgi:peptidyl-prolyl cis-trans isomerase A (cyclophilin A)